ncbi:hypothetical protein ASD03_27460 [Ensifer sp. Root127]|nr:hypothetical protein ASD03_27460 [Ensifer sp. Root127]
MSSSGSRVIEKQPATIVTGALLDRATGVAGCKQVNGQASNLGSDVLEVLHGFAPGDLSILSYQDGSAGKPSFRHATDQVQILFRRCLAPDLG